MLCGGCSILTLLFRKPIAGLYIKGNSEIFDMACFAIVMLAIQIPLKAILDSRIRYLQGIHRKYSMNILIGLARFINVVVAAYVCGRLFGVYGVLACFTVSDIVTLLEVYIYYVVKCRKVFPSRHDFLNLPSEFNYSPGDVISLDICDNNDVSLGSEQIMLFAKGHGVDKRTGYYAALAFEELANNIIERGFPLNQSGYNMIDLRVVATKDTLVIRMLDNCPHYNVTDYFAEVNADNADITKDIGVRIVSKIAKDINYFHTFETNNVTLRFERKKLTGE